MSQPQYYEQNWNNHFYSSPSQWGYNTHEPYCQPSFQQSSYTLFPKQPTEEPIDWEKRMEVLDELEWWIKILEDLKTRQTFQVTDPYSIFQEEHANLEKSMEIMIQCQMIHSIW